MQSTHKDEKSKNLVSFSSVQQEDSFDKEIEQILTNFNEKTADLTQLQTQIISMVRKYSQSEMILIDPKNTDIDDKVITKNVNEASVYLMKQRENIIKDNVTLAEKSNNFELIDKKSKEDFKRLVKGFAIYEIYKCMNPERIAGETKQDNFSHNLATRGLKKADHYAGVESLSNQTKHNSKQQTTAPVIKQRQSIWER
ncbi:MAG: hypothetical protein EOP33_02110 [Rickettsiaceae bacterium]|nr:MAG: hypothetical protein EOP33_02110 [Rickettsiaceae bacterium]